MRKTCRLSSVTMQINGKACNFFAVVTVVLPIKHTLAVQNELVAAYNELRDELAQEKWGKDLCCFGRRPTKSNS